MSVSFDDIGGLGDHLETIRKRIIFPLVTAGTPGSILKPPRGVLFFGPPGTGKTLVAKACATECSKYQRKIEFFTYSTASIMSKYFGESENNMRRAFKKAHQSRPAIIFFDEIDGIAPARSTTRMEQTNISIVSVLLQCMDGCLENDDIVVIGTTNRLEALDPALRRVGRFDLELKFGLPSLKDRAAIVRQQTKSWETPPTDELIEYIAVNTVGYNGSDLKGLCDNALMIAMERVNPNFFQLSMEIEHDASLHEENVKTLESDFKTAIAVFNPTSRRLGLSLAKKLEKSLEPLVRPDVDRVVKHIKEKLPNMVIFPTSAPVGFEQTPRLLLLTTDDDDSVTTHLVPELIHQLDEVTLHTIKTASLFGDSENRSACAMCEEKLLAVTQAGPAILYFPKVAELLYYMDDATKDVFSFNMTLILENPKVFVLATANGQYNDLAKEVVKMFPSTAQFVLTIGKPGQEARYRFFQNLFTTTLAEAGEPTFDASTITALSISEQQPSTSGGGESSSLNAADLGVLPLHDYQVGTTSGKSTTSRPLFKVKKILKQKLGGARKTTKKVKRDKLPRVVSQIDPTRMIRQLSGRCEPRFDDMSTSTLSTSSDKSSLSSEESMDEYVDVSLDGLLLEAVRITEGYSVNRIRNTYSTLKRCFDKCSAKNENESLLQSLYEELCSL